MTSVVSALISVLVIAFAVGAFLFLRFTAPHNKEQPWAPLVGPTTHT